MESGDASTSELEETVIATTNGSFQNQPSTAATTRCRKRGISALLQDIGNLPDAVDSRGASKRARRDIKSQQQVCAPRGNAPQGAKARHSNPQDRVTSKSPTLFQLKGDLSVFSKVAESLLTFIQRQIPHDVQKAIAINIMATAISEWECSITEAGSRPADCTGFTVETVRQWPFSYITMAPSENISDEYIAQELACNCGCHDSHTDSLVDDKEFQLAAREFVRKNANRKGERNLTCKTWYKIITI